ncbi:hypothetical protein PILCRDRAFT_484387 [Piloderma croceum F 1598]|uniref:Uncharacterized protein n=1 Tax=Piloderma croceum (strain F 1598) TaxID=765440 RepID=A0A0C3FQT3_PILCF|nr:hypothetical protein PILCRDRAFT_484387 [Piloderma croceum F 1598]
MKDCLIHNHVSGTAPMLDYCYFYLENGYGRYTCGLARQGIIEFLRIYAEESVFLGPEWYLALMSLKNNPSVIGFTVEQMVISRLASSGLRWGDKVIHPAPLTSFSGSVTVLSTDKPSTYYIPLHFNFKAIDALYAEVNEHKKTVNVVAIQVTVAKRHTDSETKFFADWEAWTSSLRSFTITLMFLWIVESKRGRDEVEAKLIELRQRQITAIPAHATHWVMIDQVDKLLAETLATIRPQGDVGVMGEAMAVHISHRESYYDSL